MLSQEGLPWQRPGSPGGSCRKTAARSSSSSGLLNRLKRTRFVAYLRSGGGVIGSAHHLAGALGTTTRQENVFRTSSARAIESFGFPGVLDLGLIGGIPREANRLRTQQNDFALFAGPTHGRHGGPVAV